MHVYIYIYIYIYIYTYTSGGPGWWEAPAPTLMLEPEAEEAPGSAKQAFIFLKPWFESLFKLFLSTPFLLTFFKLLKHQGSV